MNTTMSPGQNEFSLENIRMLIGDSEYNQLFGEGGPFYGFDDVKSTLSLNNQNVSINYLLQMIQKLNQNEIEIINVETE